MMYLFTKSSALIILFVLTTCNSNITANVKTIEEVRMKSQGESVSIRGTVLNGSELGSIRYIQDHTAGIAVYDFALSNTVTGDSIEISGTLDNWNNLIQITSVTEVNDLGKASQMPEPVKLNISEAFTADYESRLVEVEAVSFLQTGFFIANQNYDIVSATDTAIVRIDGNSNITGEMIPYGQVNISGIMSRFQQNYQLIPRKTADINFTSGPGIISQIKPVEIKRHSIKFNYETRDTGTTGLKYGKTKALEKGVISINEFNHSHSLRISSLQPSGFYYVKAFSVDKHNDTSFAPLKYFSTASESSGKILAYFNRPVETSVSSGQKAQYIGKSIPDTLKAYIERATESIEMAIYNFNNENISVNISDALNDAFDRGVSIRIIANGNTANRGLNELNPAIPVHRSPTDDNHSIMHHKFLIFDAKLADKATVWTGSTNLTTYQLNRDPNNVIILQDKSLAKAYTLEFNEMWGSDNATADPANARFGQFKKDLKPEWFNLGGKYVRLMFSPLSPTTAAIAKSILEAENEIYTAVFAFTHPQILNSLIFQANEGLFIASLFDNKKDYNQYAFTQLKNILDSTVITYGKEGQLHHKYMIRDPSVEGAPAMLLTGSHNWSMNAENRNDENTLFIYCRDIAGIYYQEWLKRYKESGGSKLFDGQTGFYEEIPPTQQKGFNSYYHNHRLYISLPENRDSKLALDVFDLFGRKLYSSYVFGRGKKVIDLPESLKGYLLIRQEFEQQISVKKAVNF
jgi:phosphatidylserine/phosphatidylglycerophosphate/cardiolipin synthase-like enzyme